MSERWTAIGDHGLIASGRSSALVAPDARIEWWCDELDGEPWLWALLDGDGAAAAWHVDADGAFEPEPDEPSAGRRTTRVLPGTGASAVDTLVDVDGRAVLVREVHAGRAPLSLRHEVALGGFTIDRARWGSSGVASIGDRPVAHVSALGALGTVEGDSLVHRFELAPGGVAVLTVALGAEPVPLALDALRALGDEQDASLRRRLDEALVVDGHTERVRQAIAVLEACTYTPSGAVVAAPTTSLPEVLAGDRQFDYRYCWVRDASLATSVAALYGWGEASESHLAWVCGHLGELDEPLGPVATVRGDAVPDEREVDHVGGYRASRPVRVGNAAGTQVQLDSAGFLAEALWVHVQTGGPLPAGTWELLVHLAELALPALDEPSNGMWEFRDAGRYSSTDVGAWLLFDRILRLARWKRPWTRRRRFRVARDRLAVRVHASMRADGSLPRDLDDPEGDADAVGLLAVMLGLVRGDAAVRLVDGTLAALDIDGSHVRRYPVDRDDRFESERAGFVPVSWWAVSALACIGRIDDAEARMDGLCRSLPPLLPEEFDPVAGLALGNTPLVWSHAELARAAYVVHAARLRRRFTPLGLGLWRLSRFVRLWRRRRRRA